MPKANQERSLPAVFFGVLVIVMSPGCTTMLVSETGEPAKLLTYATRLFDQQDQPIQAERLIREAIDIYQKENNDLGLAEAFRQYGFFFRSDAVETHHSYYEKNGFLDPRAIFRNRYDMSIDYFKKAEALLLTHDKYDALTNVYLNMGFTYEFADKNDQACASYRKSISTNRKFIQEHPGATFDLPGGYVDYEAYVSNHLERLRCSDGAMDQEP